MSMIDPNETLDMFRTNLSEYSMRDSGDEGREDALVAAVEAAAALDAHLSEGGALPNAWDKWHQTRTHLEQHFAAAQAGLAEPLGPPDPANGELPDES